jgi:hypothetical protein
MTNRKRVADSYMDSLTIERGRFPRSNSQDDYSEAQRYSVGIYVADLLPSNEVMQARLLIQHMQATLRAMEVKICNSSAYEVDDAIVPPQMGEAIPPLEFPRTITPFQMMTAIEQYYGQPHEGDAMAMRISRIRRAYNVGIIMMEREEVVTRRVAL